MGKVAISFRGYIRKHIPCFKQTQCSWEKQKIVDKENYMEMDQRQYISSFFDKLTRNYAVGQIVKDYPTSQKLLPYANTPACFVSRQKNNELSLHDPIKQYTNEMKSNSFFPTNISSYYFFQSEGPHGDYLRPKNTLSKYKTKIYKCRNT